MRLRVVSSTASAAVSLLQIGQGRVHVASMMEVVSVLVVRVMVGLMETNEWLQAKTKANKNEGTRQQHTCTN